MVAVWRCERVEALRPSEGEVLLALGWLTLVDVGGRRGRSTQGN